MIKRFHRRAFIILILIIAFMLDGLAWLLGMYGSQYQAVQTPMVFVLMSALAPWLAILLLILGVIEMKNVKHPHPKKRRSA